MKFTQIAVAMDAEGNECFYALSEDGIIYEKMVTYYSPGGKYKGRSIIRGRTVSSPFWREVYLSFAEPELEENKLGLLELEEEK